jgi:phytoene synthase
VTSLPIDDVTPVSIARAAISYHSKSFALASRLLGSRVRDQTAVVYAWCRRADDAVDAAPVSNGAELIARLSAELDASLARSAYDPVLAAFGEVARERAIPRSYPAELLAGMAMDVSGTTYATVDDLIAYAWRVAGVVGLMMTHVFGTTSDDALVHAAHLGIAMQLTNISRDVVEDWQRGRLYIPDELLARHGAAGLAGELGSDLPASAKRPIAGAIADLLAIADRYYRSGDRGIASLPWRAALAVRVARRVYAAIGAQIARAGYDVTAGRAVVTRGRKLVHVVAAAAESTFAAPARIVRAANGRGATTPARTLELRDVPRL